MTNATRRRLAVVIPSVRPDRCVELLRRVLPQCEADGADVIVVDDTRDGRVVDAVTDSYVRVVRGASSGPSCARNLGVSSSHADIIVLLDDDVVVGPDLISTIRNRLEQSDALIAIDVAIYSGQQATDGSWRWRRVERTVPGGFLSACLAFPREAFDRIGGFEESWPVPNREDTDFGLRLAGHVSWQFESKHVLTHPDERIGLHSLLRLASFARIEPRFLARHGMAGNVRSVGIGPLRIRGIRIWLPPVMTVVVVGSIIARRPRFALAVSTAAGMAQSASHSQYLGFASRRDLARSLLPSRWVPWSLSMLVGGVSFLRGVPAGFTEARRVRRESKQPGCATGRT